MAAAKATKDEPETLADDMVETSVEEMLDKIASICGQHGMNFEEEVIDYILVRLFEQNPVNGRVLKPANNFSKAMLVKMRLDVQDRTHRYKCMLEMGEASEEITTISY